MTGFSRAFRRAHRQTSALDRPSAGAGRLIASLLMFAAVAGGLWSGTTASAQDAPKWAYVFTSDYTGDTPAADDGYQFNSTGEANTVTRSGVGAYTVIIAGLAKESQTQLTTISENGERCKLADTKSVIGSVATEHTVTCFAISGDPVDIGFFLLQNSGGLVKPSAYVWAHDKAAAETYTPNPVYQFNTSGEQNTSTRTDVGTYTIALPGQGTESGNIQVTPMRAAPGVSCAVRRWELSEANEKFIEVNCFDSTGTRVDAEFSLLYVDGSDAAVEGVTTTGAFLIADHASADGRYTPGQNFQFSTAGVPADVERTEMGSYTVFLSEVGASSGDIQITASAAGDAIACNTPGGVVEGTSMQINVFCFDSAGAPADSAFNLTFVIATAPMP